MKLKQDRRDSLKVLNFILSSISNGWLIFFYNLLISHLNCVMTHIHPYIKEGLLLWLDILVKNYSSVPKKKSYKVLLNL